jgi:hypothetical protein
VIARLAIVAAASLQLSAAPVLRAPLGDPAPRGMVAFVTASPCPAGWAPAGLVLGRALVGTDATDTVGRVVGAPLTPEEDRVHGHELGAAAIALPFRSISAADGGNQQGAGAGNRPLTGAAAAAPSGLPFIQVLTCVVP